MKSLRNLFLFVLLLSSALVSAQNVTVQVTGQVIDQQTGMPIPGHQVAVTVYPDSINTFFPYSDSAYTDPTGAYILTFPVYYTPGVASFFSVGTYDCQNYWQQQFFTFTGNLNSFTADFAICSDTIFPPSPCENYILPDSIQGLTVTLHGGLYGTQQATSLYWDLGDNTYATGETVTHTYAQQGVYVVTLQTLTSDSCSDFSEFLLVLNDSINPPSLCESYISLSGLQEFTATFEGIMLNGQQAEFNWDFGDGSTGNGQVVTHTYTQQGFYTVVLQSVTNDSCYHTSLYTLMLMDSIPNGCAGYFSATPTGLPYEIAFEGFTQSNYPVEYSWEFGDGTTASGQSIAHTYCCPGTYLATLTTSDSSGCTSTFVSPVLVSPDSTGNMVISGQVFAGTAPINQGMVVLFNTDPSGYYYQVQTTYIDSAGYYSFWNLGTGTYLILAFPQPDSLNPSMQFLPTYFGDVVFWDQATSIYLGVPLNPYNINLVSYDSISGGNGTINGQITGGGKSMLTAGQEVLLLDAFGNPVRIAYTDGQGNFSFNNLPFGEYSVHPVITGVTTQPAQLVIDEGNPSATVIMTINGHLITGLIERKSTNLISALYPNPVVDLISLTIQKPGSYKVLITDAMAKTVILRNEEVAAVGTTLRIDVSELVPGVYMLMLQNASGEISSRRFIKN